jgi:hypothetical protein
MGNDVSVPGNASGATRELRRVIPLRPRTAYRVTSADPLVGAAVEHLWGPHLPRGLPASKKLRWFYRANPNGAGRVLLLMHDTGGRTEVVGCAGIGPRVLHVEGVPIRAAWLTDLGVDKTHRTGMPALVLQRAVRTHCRAGYAVSYGFPNAHAVGVYARVGYHPVGKLTRYVRVLRHAEYVQRRGWRPLAARVAGWTLDAPGRAKAWVSCARADGNTALEWVTDADRRFDDLWKRAHARHIVVERRGAAQIRWRFLSHPSRLFDVGVLADAARKTIRAYVVVERAQGTANVWDLFGESNDAVKELLDRAAADLRARGAFAISVYALGPRMDAMLGACGFCARDADKTLVVDVEGAPEEARAAVLDPASWWVADGGEDA